MNISIFVVSPQTYSGNITAICEILSGGNGEVCETFDFYIFLTNKIFFSVGTFALLERCPLSMLGLVVLDNRE